MFQNTRLDLIYKKTSSDKDNESINEDVFIHEPTFDNKFTLKSIVMDPIPVSCLNQKTK